MDGPANLDSSIRQSQKVLTLFLPLWSSISLCWEQPGREL